MISDLNAVAEHFLCLWVENRVQPHQGRAKVAEVALVCEAANEHQRSTRRPRAGFSKTVSATLKGAQTEESVQRSEY